MFVSGNPTFELEAFCHQPPDRLEVLGTWNGIDQYAVSEALLVVVVDGDARTLRPLTPSRARGIDSWRWGACYEFAADPGRITRAELRVGPGITVPLPLPSERRRRFGRRVLDVHWVTTGAGVTAPSAPETRSDEVAGARAEVARLRAEADRERRKAASRVATAAKDVVRVREQLDAAHASIAELAPELDRERDLRAALRDELEQARAELRTVTESRDQLHAWTQLELERLREQHEGLERVRRKEAADVERLSGTVRALRADMAHVVLQHRAAVDRLAAEVEAGLHELEAVASESCDHADVARRALESMGEPASSTVRDHLDVIATQVREVAGMAARLRRSVARARAVERRRTIREGS